jgi:hypothetical protein
MLFEALIKHPVRRVVTASSMSIYGEGLYRETEGALVETADGVRVFDDLLLRAITAATSPHAVRLCWDVDRRRHARRTPRGARSLPSRHSPHARRRVHLRRRSASNRRLRSLRRAGMRAEPQRARSRYPPPGPPAPRFAADLNFLANRPLDREARVETFFLAAAERLPDHRRMGGDRAVPHP